MAVKHNAAMMMKRTHIAVMISVCYFNTFLSECYRAAQIGKNNKLSHELLISFINNNSTFKCLK